MAANLSQWRARAERASKALEKFREATSSNVVHVRHDLESVGLGAIAGAVRGAVEGSGRSYEIPIAPGVGIPPEAAIGGAMLALALSGQTDATPDLHAGAAGILAYGAGHQAYVWMKNKRLGNPGGNGAAT